LVSGVRIQKTDDIEQKPEVRGQMTESKGGKKEISGWQASKLVSWKA